MSTTEQDTSLQLAALNGYGVDVIYQERLSAVKHRPQLAQLLDEIGAGDELVVYKLDRVARSMRHLLQIVEHLESRNARLRSLTEPINDETPAGRLMVQMLGAFAEFERGLIRERAIAGQIEAIKRGVQFGAKRKLTDSDRQRIVQLMRQGQTMTAIAVEFGVHRLTIRRAYIEGTGGVYPTKRGKLPILGKYIDNKPKASE